MAPAVCAFCVCCGGLSVIGFCVEIFLVCLCLLVVVGVGVSEFFSMESLILAQDERWRRA